MEVVAWFTVWTLAPALFTGGVIAKSSSTTNELSSTTAPTASMVKHKVFGVERDLDIPADVFPSEEEIAKSEAELLPGCEHGWMESVYQKAQLHYRKFLPAGGAKPKAVVIWAHGISAHSGNAVVLPDGRKLNLSLVTSEFLKQGYALYAMDMYGHGFSEGIRWYIPGTWKNNLQDLVNFSNLVASFHADVPLFLMGESYGSNLVIHAARQFQDNPSSGPNTFDSIIVTAPAIMGDLPPYPVYLILRYIFYPISPVWRPFFMPNPIRPERIWRDPAVLAMHTDPEKRKSMIDGSGIPFRLGTGVGLIDALTAVQKVAIPGFKVPYCILHGTSDYGVPIAGSEYMWKTAATPEADREFHSKEGAYHDLFSDPKPVAEECIQHCLSWIQKRLEKK